MGCMRARRGPRGAASPGRREQGRREQGRREQGRKGRGAGPGEARAGEGGGVRRGRPWSRPRRRRGPPPGGPGERIVIMHVRSGGAKEII